MTLECCTFFLFDAGMKSVVMRWSVMSIVSTSTVFSSSIYESREQDDNDMPSKSSWACNNEFNRLANIFFGEANFLASLLISIYFAASFCSCWKILAKKLNLNPGCACVYSWAWLVVIWPVLWMPDTWNSTYSFVLLVFIIRLSIFCFVFWQSSFLFDRVSLIITADFVSKGAVDYIVYSCN